MKATEIKSGELFKELKQRIAELGLPLPKKPEGTDPEFEFPTDPSALTGPRLGQFMMRFAGYFAYCQRLLSLLESELALVDAEYRLRVSSARLRLSAEEYGKRPSGDVVEAAALEQDEALTPLYKRRLELLGVKELLAGRLLIYEKLHAALSRELSRREMESRLAMTG